MWWLIILWLLQPVTITSGTPITITLTAGAGPVGITYTAAPGEVLTVTAQSRAAEPIDVTLEILLDNERIAFNDDHRIELADLAPQDSAITHLIINEAGDYILRIHSFNGAQSGEVEVLVQSRPLVEPCQRPAQTVELLAHHPFTCLLDLQIGQTVALTARDISGTLDLVLALLDSEGALLARNDDHASADLTLNVLDARIANYEVVEAGTYAVRVSDFGGTAGTLELRVDIES
jgi:hypothetical protein